MKKKIIQELTLLFFLLLFITTASYAWFISFSSSVNNIIITTGKIDMSGTLYQMSDFNLDGELDIDGSGNYIATQITSINISNMDPGDEYTYRLDATNLGTVNGNLSLLLSEFSGYLKDVLFVESVDPAGFDKVFLSGKSGGVLISDSITLSVNETKSIFFKIKFATITELDANGIIYNNSLGGLGYYQTKQFNISKLTLKLTQ